MDQNPSSKETQKERYNLDDDTSSFSPEIEEESNNEEEAPSHQKEPLINQVQQNTSQLMDKLISIQKQMDTNQKKIINNKNSSSNYKENNNTDNKLPKNKIKNNNKKNKDILNLDESDSDSDNDEDISNDNDTNNNNDKNKNIIKKNTTQIQSPLQKKEKGCELFIGNLNISTEKEDLNSLFNPFGEITDIRIHKNEENKKCYAFVRFSSKESATSALKLDSSLLNNRRIKVTKSNENATIFIGNIRKTWTKEELETKIRRIFHNINKIEFFTDPGNPNKNRGFCFGIFNTRNEAIKALNYVNKKGGINIDGISLTCDWADVVDDDDNSQSNQIFISNIKQEVNEQDLKKYFDKLEKVVVVIMSKNHLNSKRKDLAFITFESHESALSAIKKFEEEKKNPEKEKTLRKIFLLSDKESVNSIQVSLAFSQEAMQNKKKIKDNRKKVPNQNNKGNSNNNNNNNSNDNNTKNSNNNGNNNNKNSGKTFMGNISMNAQNEYKNYSSGLRSKNYQRHDHGRSHNFLGGNKNVQDLFSSLNNINNNNNNKNMYRNNSLNYQGNKNNNNNLYNQFSQLFANSLENNNMNKSTNAYMNNNNNNNNLNPNQINALTNLINMCQQNPNFLQQMTNNINNLYNGNELININNDKKFLNRKRNNNNYLENNDNENNLSNNNSNEIQNNTYLNISQTNQTQNQNFIPQFPYIQNIPPLSPINTSNIQNLQNIIPTIPNNIQNNPNFN